MSGVNRIVRSVAPKSFFESAQALIDATVSFNQGDLMALDTVGNKLKVVTVEADSANFLGIARDTVVLGKLARPYATPVDASAAISDVAGPQIGVVAKLVLKTGDAIVPGGLVYLDPASGTHHVTVTVGTQPVGIYQGKALTAVAGQEIEVLLGSKAFGGIAI